MPFLIIVSPLSVIIGDLDIMGAIRHPDKADLPFRSLSDIAFVARRKRYGELRDCRPRK